jgi:hypothetical protein
MAKEADLRKHFEAILGQDTAADVLDEGVVVRTDVAAYSSIVDGSVTSREIGTTGDSTKTCRQAGLLDVSGLARTGADGTTKFVLSDFFCRAEGVAISYPVNFVATPRSRTPVFLTARRSLTADLDLEIEVLTWDVTGSPAPNISFDWRCRARFRVSEA